MTLKNFLQNKKYKIYTKTNKTKRIIKSVWFTKSILQKSRLFMSKLRFPKKDITKIQPASQATEIISLLDSLVIKLVFSTKYINKLQIIQNKNANK
jgi:hypothetical protein